MKLTDSCKQAIRARLLDYLQATHKPARERDKWNCPCGSSDALHFNAGENTWHCYSCDAGGDIIALYAADNNLDNKQDFKRIVTDLSERYCITLDNEQEPAAKAQETAPKAQEPEQDYSTSISLAAAQLVEYGGPMPSIAQQARDYLEQRGIMPNTWQRFGLGVMVDSCSLVRLVIPSADRKSCNMRIAGNASDYPNFPKYMRRGKARLFTALQEPAQEPAPCWIVEGEIDALSIWQACGSAIATSSASNAKLAIDYAQENRDKHSAFVVFYDNDKTGQEKAQGIIKALANLQIPCYAWPRRKGDTRDANDIMRDDIAAGQGIYGGELARMIEQAKRLGALTIKVLSRVQPQDGSDGFNDTLTRLDNNYYGRFYTTPFPQLNDALYGGFHAGLVVLGATTGAGKTTYALQLASWLAERCRVLYISMEMSKAELHTRILSRLATESRGADTAGGDITALQLRQHFADWKTRGYVQQAIHRFKTYMAPRFNVVEGIRDFSAEQIADLAAYYAALDGEPPVVIVDYLQMLAPIDSRQTDKQATDASIRTLKQLSRDLNALVIAISSYNRDAYDKENPSLKALKESGAIEYTADLVLALDAPEDLNPDRGANLRNIVLHCLKNRDGRQFKLPYTYEPAVNRFKEEDNTRSYNTRSREAPRRY